VQSASLWNISRQKKKTREEQNRSKLACQMQGRDANKLKVAMVDIKVNV